MKSRPKKRKLGRKGPIRIGLTGSLGSGKSTALKVFQQEAWQCLSADQIVREIYEAEGEELEELRQKCLKSPRALRELEKKVHPKVRRRIYAAMKNSKLPIVVEVPLLFEAGLNKKFDWNICIHAPLAERKRRTLGRGMKAKLFDYLNSRQWPPEEKAAASDFVIWNLDGKISQFRKQVRILIHLLSSLS